MWMGMGDQGLLGITFDFRRKHCVLRCLKKQQVCSLDLITKLDSKINPIWSGGGASKMPALNSSNENFHNIQGDSDDFSKMY